MNAIAIEILLYYFGNEQRYINLKSELKAYVIQKYKMHPTTILRRSAEMVVLTLDLFACPYISKEYKWKLASMMNVSKDDFKSILRYFRSHRSMFMRWEGVDITKELNAKVSQEVYA